MFAVAGTRYVNAINPDFACAAVFAPGVVEIFVPGGVGDEPPPPEHPVEAAIAIRAKDVTNRRKTDRFCGYVVMWSSP